MRLELRPNADFVFEGLDVKIPPTRIRISEQGLRDDVVAIPRPKGVRRLICVGDSITFGWGVEQEDTFCSRLEAELNQTGRSDNRWETINLGMPGLNAEQSVHLLATQGMRFQPDTAVFLFNISDYEPPLDPGDPGDLESWLVDHSNIVRWLQFRKHRLDGPAQHEASLSSVSPIRPAGPKIPSPPVGTGATEHWDSSTQDVGLQQAWRAMDRLASLQRERGLKVGVFFLTDLDERDRQLANRMKALGLSHASLESTGADDSQIPNDGHPDKEGHRRLTEGIFSNIMAWGMAL